MRGCAAYECYIGRSPMANPKYAVSDKPVPVAELVDTLSDGTKVKRRLPRMRACGEKDAPNILHLAMEAQVIRYSRPQALS